MEGEVERPRLAENAANIVAIAQYELPLQCSDDCGGQDPAADEQVCDGQVEKE